MEIISVFDTTISDYNLGNQIIMESVFSYLEEIFPDAFFYKVPYLDITGHTIHCLNQSGYAFFGGTNSLCGDMAKYSQWGIKQGNYKRIKNVVLMGLGWWQYQGNTTGYTKKILSSTLCKSLLHSVRDSYTQKKLEDIGISNVINTGCPTIWGLDESHCNNISKKKSTSVITTLTDYSQDFARDSEMLDIIFANYSKVYFWIQGKGDLEYLQSFPNKHFYIIPPKLHNYDKILEDERPDYVGTRLHGGIRALQKSCRAIIVAVDNRAREMRNDFMLPVSEISELSKMIESNLYVKLDVPFENIAIWKQQFSDRKDSSIMKARKESLFERINNRLYESFWNLFGL